MTEFIIASPRQIWRALLDGLKEFINRSEKGGFPEELCVAKVILIPKGAITKLHDPLGVRPIALLTSWYKIIDNVLNNKIKEILDPQISRR